VDTKLTLMVDKDVIVKAKHFAKNTGRSLSDIVENYLNSITNEASSEKGLSPNLKKLVGIVKLPKDFNEKKELLNYSHNKHLGK
jgi:hypothetical protein